MTTQDNSVERFIEMVGRMREAQRAYFETKSNKALRDSMSFEKMVDAWLVARRIDMQKLAKWSGIQEKQDHDTGR